MIPFFKRKKFTKKVKTDPEQKNIFAVLDIGTDLVKTLVCREEKGKAYILGVGKQRQKLGDMHQGAVIDIENVAENCREALKEAEEMAHICPSDVIIGIAGELVKGLATTIEYERRDYMDEISMAELQNIVHKVQWKAFNDIRREIQQETDYKELDVKLVHSSISQVEIDAYKISNPLAFKGRNVKMTVFNVFAPLIHFESMMVIAEMLEKTPLSIALEPYAVSKALGFEDGSDFSTIFIDIGGGTTDVAVVVNGGIAGTKMFGIGGRIFTKRLAKHFNIPYMEAEQYKIRFSKGKLEKKEEEKIKGIYETDIAVWLEGLTVTLKEFDGIDILPSKILLCGGGALLPGIKEALQKTDWYTEAPFSKKPQVSFIRPKDIINIVDTTNMIKDIQDVTPMALANLGLQLSGRETVLNHMLKKAIRIVER